jgi:PAS domain S-box-containing protein
MKTENNWTSFINWFAIRPRTIGLLLFLVLSIVTVFVGFLCNHIHREEERKKMNIILTDAHRNIEQSLKNCYTTTVSLALSLNNDGIPENFEAISKQLIKSNPIVSVVQLVPNGVIKYIYPMKGNEAAMNLNILGPKHLREEAEKSVETQKMYFAGPLELKQGGTGIVGRLPIYNNNKFWGFSAVIIELETLLEVSGINSIDQSNYYFQFSKKNPITSKEQFFLPSKTDLSKSYYVSKSITDSDWILYLIAKKPFSIYPMVLLVTVLGFIVAILFGILTTQLLKKPEELRFLLKEQKTKLLKNELRFKTIIDQATIGFAIIDASSGNLLVTNKKYCDMLGYTHSEIKTKGIASLTHPDDLDEYLLNIKKLDEGKITEYVSDKRCITKSGKIIWINLTISPLWESNEKPTNHIAFVKDITKSKEAEKELNNSLQLVTEQNKRLLNFSYIISHNLRSHTSNIESIISLVESAESEDERYEMMHLLKSVSNSLDETMKHLNEVVNINTNVNLVIKPLNLSKYINKAKNVLSEQIVLNEASFIINVPDDAIINYNSAYLENILYNLISNAIRYRHHQRELIVSIKFYKENDTDVIEVSDNGIGIDLVRNADKIFGLYKTFGNNSDAKGIGLFITKNQIDTMGGTITVDSEPNIGSTFKIYVK